jgi:hypothetical protein
VTTKNVAILLAGLLITGSAQAALIDRGNGLIYDEDRNITWLANASLAADNDFGVGGVLADGRMHWSVANDWIAAMNQDSYLGNSNWRMPVAIFPDSNCTIDGSGNTDRAGLNCNQSEMGHLFYDELMGVSGESTYVNGDPELLAHFVNIKLDGYWTGTPFSPDPENQIWTFNFAPGNQDADDIPGGLLHVWAVRDGDVAATSVPEPATYALLLTGLGLIGLMAYRKRINQQQAT